MSEKVDLLKMEKEVARRTRAEKATEVSLCERFFNHLGVGFNRIGKPFSWKEPDGTILLLTTMGFNSLRWAWELLLKGYYVQANALSRTGYECWLHGAYLLLYPERLEQWRVFEKRPTPAEMRRLVAERAAQADSEVGASEFLDGMGRIYFEYSDYAHPSDLSLNVLVDEKDGGKWLRLGCDYDAVLILQSTNMFCTAAALLFTAVDRLLSESPDYHEAGEVLINEMHEWRQNLKLEEAN